MTRLDLFVTAVAGLFSCPDSTLPARPPMLRVTSTGTTDGHVQLAWEPAPDGAGVYLFQLQEADSPEFEEVLLRYEGTERGSFVSGLPAGRHYFRLRQRGAEDETWGPWSEPVSVSIEPYSLGVAWALFATGALLVTVILVFLFLADRRARAGAV